MLNVGRTLQMPLVLGLSAAHDQYRKKNAGKEPIKITDWFKKITFFKHLSVSMDVYSASHKMQVTPQLATDVYTKIKHGAAEMTKRLHPKLMISQNGRTTVINDSLEKTTEYIAMIYRWIRDLNQNTMALPPFQLDFCISYLDAQLLINEANHEQKNDEDSSGDDESSDDDEMDDYNFNMKSDLFKDIKGSLKDNNLKYKASKINANERRTTRRKLNELFTGIVGPGQMHGRRIVTWINRNSQYVDNTSDDIYMFNPSTHQEIPKQEIPEIWFLHASKTSLLPPDITVGSTCNGRLLVLSFHVKAENEIAVYLFYNGQMIYFEPVVCIISSVCIFSMC